MLQFTTPFQLYTSLSKNYIYIFFKTNNPYNQLQRSETHYLHALFCILIANERERAILITNYLQL